MIHISVIVPFYNSQRYLTRCIENLLSQKYPSEQCEIVMVDNNSTDMSAEIVKRYSRLKLVSEEKQGAYAARNRGIGEAQGGIIAFTDADSAPAHDWLKEIESAMTDSRVGIVVGGYQSARNSFSLSMLEDYENEKNNYIFNSEIKELYYGYTRNMAVRKSLFAEMGPFAERARGSDVIFIRRCVDRDSCAVVRYAPQVRVRHLEVENPRRYFQKVFIYGNSSRQYRQIVPARPLTAWERFLVFRRTVRSQRYSRIKSLFLFVLLAIGFIYWAMGSLVATWNVEQEPTT